MNKKFLLILAGFFIFSACTAKEGIEVRDAWMRPTAQGENGAVYLVIHNYSTVADELVNVSADIAQVIEFHESTMTNDVMKMQMLSSVLLDSGEDVEFAPGGLHIMLVELKREVKLGDDIEITLHFKNSEDITLKIPVREGAEEHNEH